MVCPRDYQNIQIRLLYDMGQWPFPLTIWSGLSLIAKRTCILHRIRHMVDVLRIPFWMRDIGFLRKTLTLVWPVWGPVSWSHLLVKAHFQKLGYIWEIHPFIILETAPNTDTSSRKVSLVRVWCYSTPMGYPEEANLLDMYDAILVSHCHSRWSQSKFADCIWLGPPHRKLYVPRDSELIIHFMYRILTVTT